MSKNKAKKNTKYGKRNSIDVPLYQYLFNFSNVMVGYVFSDASSHSIRGRVRLSVGLSRKVSCKVKFFLPKSRANVLFKSFYQ